MNLTTLHTSNGVEASVTNPCPLCDGDNWCFHLNSNAVICGKSDRAPIGWLKTGEAKDGRGIFAREGRVHQRGNLPNPEEILPLSLDPKTDSLRWVILSTVGSESEQQIEYLYPDPETGQPLGKVRRKQWSDRRAVYGRSGRDTKEIRPWHWVEPHHPDQGNQGWWSDRGKGSKPWPLYKQAEVRDAIASGAAEVVFFNGGEQAVETARQLGLTSFCNQGGEGSYLQEIINFLSGNKPKLFVICPDNNDTGRKTSDKLLKLCVKAGIPAIAIEPTNIWSDLPQKGDITDIVNSSGMDKDEIIERLEIEISRALLIRQNEQQNSALFNSGKTAKLPPADQVGKQLSEDYQSLLAFNNETATWMRYEADYPGVWSPETDDLIDSLVDQVLESKGISGYGSSSYVTNVVKAMKRRLIVRKWLEKSPKELLPYQNGVLDVLTGSLLPHAPGYRFTWALPRIYNPLALDWEPINQWMQEVTGNNPAIKKILLCWLNALLKGRSDLQVFLHLTGPGGTGKGTFMRLCVALIGEVNNHSSCLNDWNTNRFESANAYRKRLVTFPDEDKYSGGLGRFKSLTGGDHLRGEEKGKRAFQYVFDGMVMMASNYPIFASDTSSGMARRCLTVPFVQSCPKGNRRNLDREFAPYLDALTNYVLSIPDEEVTATLLQLGDSSPEVTQQSWEYRMRTDSVAAWLNECVIHDEEAMESVGADKDDVSTLFGSYHQYCDRTGSRAKGSREFSPSLLDLCNHILGWADVFKVNPRNRKFLKGLKLRTSGLDDNIPNPIDALSHQVTGQPVTGYGSGYGSEPLPDKENYGCYGSNELLEKNQSNNSLSKTPEQTFLNTEEIDFTRNTRNQELEQPPDKDATRNLTRNPTADSPVTPVAQELPTPESLAAQITKCQSWSAALELIDDTSIKTGKKRVTILKNLFNKCFSECDRQYFLELLNAHVAQFPQDERAAKVLAIALSIATEKKIE